MEYKFDNDVQAIVDSYIERGYSVERVVSDTIHIKDKNERVVNAFMEPCKVVLAQGRNRLAIEVYPAHERKSKGRTVKSLMQITGNVREDITAEVFVDGI